MQVIYIQECVHSGQHQPQLKYNIHHYKLTDQYYNISMYDNVSFFIYANTAT